MEELNSSRKKIVTLMKKIVLSNQTDSSKKS